MKTVSKKCINSKLFNVKCVLHYTFVSTTIDKICVRKKQYKLVDMKKWQPQLEAVFAWWPLSPGLQQLHGWYNTIVGERNRVLAGWHCVYTGMYSKDMKKKKAGFCKVHIYRSDTVLGDLYTGRNRSG